MSSSKIFLPDSFPQEIIDRIIDFVNADPKDMRRSFALTSCAAVSRKFRARARTHLFHTVTFDSDSRTATRLCALLADNDHLRKCVREMRFDGPEGRAPGRTVWPWSDKPLLDLLPQLTNLTALTLSSFETTKFLACFPPGSFRFVERLRLESCIVQLATVRLLQFMERFPTLQSLSLDNRCRYPDRPDMRGLGTGPPAVRYPIVQRLSVQREVVDVIITTPDEPLLIDWRRLFSSIVFRELEQLSVPHNSTQVELNAVAIVAPRSITSLTLPYTSRASQDWDTETDTSHPIDMLLQRIAHAVVTFPTQEVSLTGGRTTFPTWWVHKLGQGMDRLQTLRVIVDFVPEMDESYGAFYYPAFWVKFDEAAAGNVRLESVEIIIRCTINGEEKDKDGMMSFFEMVKRCCSELGKRGDQKFKIMLDNA